MKFSIIVAVDNKDGISKDGKIPWKEPYDMEFFKETTTKTKNTNKQNVVIMGNKTWKTLKGPLKNRVNIVLSNTEPETDLNIINQPIPIKIVFNSFESSLNYIKAREDVENIFVIGGSKIYDLALKHPYCKYIYITRIYSNYNCDNFFPNYDKSLYKNKIIRLKDNLIIYKNKRI